MQVKTQGQKYGLFRKLNHWSIAIIFIGLLISGIYMVNFHNHSIYPTHKAFGVILLTLTVIRVLWLMFDNKMDNSKVLTKVERIGSASMHGALYLLMFIMPISGIVMSMSLGYKISIFGLFNLPMIIEKSETIARISSATHEIAGYTACVLVAGHIAAALYHHFIKKDQILKRMV